MNKLYKLILLVCLLTLLTTNSVALATTNDEQEIQQLAQQSANVTKAKCIVHMRVCVIALQTNGFASHKEYNSYVQNLVSQVKDNYNVDNVYVSRSPKVMKLIDSISGLDEKDRQRVIDRIIDLATNKRPSQVQPRQKIDNFNFFVNFC